MKSAAQSSKKWVEKSGQSAGDYKDGVLNTTKDQAAAAIAAAADYASGVQAAITRGAFAKGLQKSGKSKWQQNSAEKGANRFGEGVANAENEYVQGSSAYDGARAAASSMPRGPKGSEQRYARSKAVGQALRKQKLGA